MDSSPVDVSVAERIIRAHVKRHYEDQTDDCEGWRHLPEIPNKSEIMTREAERTNSLVADEAWNAYQTEEPIYDPNLPINIVKGPWPSKEAYIGSHYEILREDAIAGLRKAVKSVQLHPHMEDDNSTHVYTHIHIKGIVLSQTGPAFRVEFSHERAGKQIRWKQSPRLQQGTIVALSPMSDSFRSVCKIAIVAARPFEGGLDQNPPQIDLFWGDIQETEFDPVEPYVMIESRTGYFEASRHMLVALQKLRTEPFRLSRYLADLDQDIGCPDWLETQRYLDLTSLVRRNLNPDSLISAEEELALRNTDVLKGFPTIPCSGMDESQVRACEQMVTRKVSIVQGPPGTGKTFTSVSALRVLLGNMGSNSPPIIIAAQTNHALDQLMNHIMTFEPNVVRLGGRSDRENIEILKRTLFELRTNTKDFSNGARGLKFARAKVDSLSEQIAITMDPLVKESILSEETLFKAGIITEAQFKSLYDEDQGWANTNAGDSEDSDCCPSRLQQWVSESLVTIPCAPIVNCGLPLEESDLEFEQLQQLEQENEDAPGEMALGALFGKTIMFGRKMTGRFPLAASDRKIKKLLSSASDLHEVPKGMRGQVFRYFEKQLNKTLLAKLKQQLAEYKTATDELKIAKWVNNFRLIKHLGTKVIGCTTTGLSKYRGLLAAVQPQILLIEEAAETLEGTVMAGMFESLEQLILVGDHKQLQANANVRALEEEPYNLSISMFERLVDNSVGFTMLNQQRRMIPDIRELLCIEPTPFYQDLHDHPSVLDRRENRVPIPGMGGKDTYFFHHNWPETKTSDLSTCNMDEAEMITEFFHYLVLNGVEVPKITVLTFYNGQRKTILQTLKRHKSLGHHTYFNVFTVDSYQGEENDVVLLSLVRSNDRANIGFLDNQNRLVVALSRARRGLYIFGNALTLIAQELPSAEDREELIRDPMWQSIITQMKNTARFDLEGGLPITCKNHGTTIAPKCAADWDNLAGGCNMKCNTSLHCGHPCPYACHPYSHDRIICPAACERILNCGHGCSTTCGQECYCQSPECQQQVFESYDIRNQEAQYDMPVCGDALWDTPTKFSGSGRNPELQTFEVASSVPLQSYSNFIGRDVRNAENMRPDRSGSTVRRHNSVGGEHRKSASFGGKPDSSALGAAINFKPPNNPWDNWDAKKADKEAADARERRAALQPKTDPSKMVYNDKHLAVKIENGVRVADPTASSTKVVPRFKSVSQTSLDSPSVQVAGLVSKTAEKVVCEKSSAILTTRVSKDSSIKQSNPLNTPGSAPSRLMGNALQLGHNRSPSAINALAPPAELISEISGLSIAGHETSIPRLDSVPESFGGAAMDEFEKLFG